MATHIPTFVERDPATIMAESKAELEILLGRTLQPAQVEQLILDFIVYRETLLVNRFNAGMAQMLIQFSKAPILDYLAELVAVTRLPASNAGCIVRFTLVPGHKAVLIPLGTRVSTSDGVAIFATTADITVSAEVNMVDIMVHAETPGGAANGYAPGEVDKILDPLAFVATVSNLDTTGGGSDVETDDHFRERIKLAPSQYSSAGARSSYEFYAKSASALITDVSVTSPIPGTVSIVVLTNSEETSQAVINQVYAVCNAENVRPLTDTVLVAAPTRVDYKIEVDIVLYEGANAATLKAQILADLKTYATEKSKALGQDIICSHIAQICRKVEVYDVSVKLPVANIEVAEDEFAECGDIIVNITGFSRG